MTPDDSTKLHNLAGRYDFVTELGQGGTGTVVKAFDKILNMTVAIKILPADSSGKSAARLQTEASSTGKFNHPNIAKIFDFGQLDNGSPYMVMEYFEGNTLATEISRRGKLENEDAIPIFIQIAKALEYSHKNGVIHRDLKPSNVLLVKCDKDKQLVKLLDFGVAKVQDLDQRLTATGALVGSPLYMSPEQADSAEVDFRSDIYSFGCLAWEVLTGPPPFQGNSALETLSMHKKQIPAPVKNFLPQTQANEELSDLIEACMQKEKTDRPQNSSVIVEKLNNILTKGENSENSDSLKSSYTVRKQNSNKKNVLVSLMFFGLFVSLGYSIFKLNTKQTIHPQKRPGSTEVKVTPLREEKKFETVPLQDNSLKINAYSNMLDSDFQILRGKKITSVKVELSEMTGAGLSYLTDSGIKALILHNTQIGDEGMKFVTKLKSLKRLEIISEELSPEGIEQIKSLSNLEVLKLDCKNLTETNFLLFSKLKQLRDLEITNCIISGKAFDALKTIKLLHTLTLQDCTFESSGAIHNFANLAKPKTLELDGSKGITSDILCGFNTSALTELSVERMPLDRQVFALISTFKNLNYLDLTDSRFAPENLDIISRLANLEILKLAAYDSMTEEVIHRLLKFHLKILNLDGTNLTDRQLLSLCKMKTLNRLSVKQCPKLTPTAGEDFERLFLSLWKKQCQVETD